jgi:hypothetical protein
VGLSGEFVNTSGSGDNFAAEGLVFVLFLCVIGEIGVLIGMGLRTVGRRLAKRA